LNSIEVSALVPTDTTRVRNMATDAADDTVDGSHTKKKREPLKGQVSREALVHDNSIFTNGTFTAADLTQLQENGISLGAGSGGKLVNLDRGRVLFAPKQDIVVRTHEGEVAIAAGSQVWVVETGNDVAVLNLNDTHKGAVTINCGGRSIAIAPGHAATLTR